MSDKSKWIQGELAIDAMKNPVDPTSEAATCWCMEGIVYAAYGDERFFDGWDKVDNYFFRNREELGTLTPFEWNDAPERTFEEVHALLRKLDV